MTDHRMTAEGAPMNATAGTRTRGSDVVKGALAFGALGPPLGLVLISTPALVQAFMADGALALLQAPGFVMILVPMSYLFGLVPAAACGGVAGLVRTLRPRWLAVLCTTLAGGATSAALGAIIRNGDVETIALLSATGACSGLLLALLFTHTARHRTAPSEPAH